MGTIKDFKCTYVNAVGISDAVTEKLNLSFPDAYLHYDTMAEIAFEIKNQDETSFCELPFCHTVEAEAMGGIINLGNESAGPRAKDYICNNINEVLKLPSIDYDTGRIAELLKACRVLREKGENVSLMVSGPFTILNVLMDPLYVFKALRKDKAKMEMVFDKFQDELLKFIDKAMEARVNIISYADSSGALNIIGPKNMEYTVEKFTYPFLKRAEKIVEGKAQIFLCPKTSLALIGTEKASWQDVEIKKQKIYVDACLELKEIAPIVGQMCIKNTGFQVKNRVKVLKLA